MKKTIILFLVILSAALFASALFFPKAEKERMIKRDNPADPKAANYQGYETADKNQILILLNSTELSNGTASVAMFSNHGYPAQSYMLSLSETFTGAEWKTLPANRLLSINVSGATGERKVYGQFIFTGNDTKNVVSEIYWKNTNVPAASPVVPVTYSVTYSGNGNTSGSVPADNLSYSAGQNVTVSANSGNLAKISFNFIGWNTSADGTGTDKQPGTTFSVGNANVILYAKWTSNPVYTVTYNSKVMR